MYKNFLTHRVYLRRNVLVFWILFPPSICLIIQAFDVDLERNRLYLSLKILGFVVNVWKLRHTEERIIWIHLVIMLLLNISQDREDMTIKAHHAVDGWSWWRVLWSPIIETWGSMTWVHVVLSRRCRCIEKRLNCHDNNKRSEAIFSKSLKWSWIFCSLNKLRGLKSAIYKNIVLQPRFCTTYQPKYHLLV